MTRKEELVWAAAWAASLRATRTANRSLEARRDIAKEDALEAILELRGMADDPDIRESDDEGDVLLRQMAGEPDCFIQHRSPPQPGTVYIMYQSPQAEAADHCHRCAAFGGWPEEEEP